MKEIPLTRGMVALVDDEDYASIAKFKWYATKASSIKYKQAFYAVRAETVGYKKQRKVSMHRVIIKPQYDMLIDHIDGNGLNNQKSNLLIVTCRQNLQNRHHNKTSRYPGVYLYKNRIWRAQIRVHGDLIDLGCHVSEEDAYLSYVAACDEVDENVQ